MKNWNQTSERSQDSGALSNPLAFLRSGNFGWSNAGLNNRGSHGDYWSLRSSTDINSYNLFFDNTDMSPRDHAPRGQGFAVRCVDSQLKA